MSLSTASNIASSGLGTVAAETAVISRNISGANDTSTFSRKIATVVTTTGGSQVVSVTRAQNRAVFDNVLTATAGSATQDAISAGLDAINVTVGSVSDSSTSSSSPAALLGNFSNALQDYAASPSDTSLAAAAVSAAKSLANGLNSATTATQAAREQADSDMNTSVNTINSLLSQFQTVNTIVVNGTATGADVTDAEDTRDSILTQLSQQLGVTTTTGTNNDVSIFTDSGITLFQGQARSVTFTPTSEYTAGTTGNVVYIDGVPATGSSSTMPITSGKLAGLATFRDDTSVQYQAQIDNIAGSLVTNFSESDQSGSGLPDEPGLFVSAGTTGMPSSNTGLAGTIAINASVDPTQGGNATLLRDGGISDTSDSNYTYNTTGDAAYTGRLSQLINTFTTTQTFPASGGINTNANINDYAANSVSWFEAQRSSVSSQSDYQSTLLSTATTALSNASGVNLDSEMSKMLDLENSYSASAKLMTTINSMFTALLNITGS